MNGAAVSMAATMGRACQAQVPATHAMLVTIRTVVSCFTAAVFIVAAVVLKRPTAVAAVAGVVDARELVTRSRAVLATARTSLTALIIMLGYAGAAG
jgi:hypothetical protein